MSISKIKEYLVLANGTVEVIVAFQAQDYVAGLVQPQLNGQYLATTSSGANRLGVFDTLHAAGDACLKWFREN